VQASLMDELTSYLLAMGSGQRGFFATSEGAVLTGSETIAVGDEVVMVPYVPTMMVLRRRPQGQSGYVVVGPAISTDQFHNEYTANELEYVNLY